MLCYQDEDKMHLPHTEDMGQVLCDDHCEIMVKQSLRMVGVLGADLLVVASDVRSGLNSAAVCRSLGEIKRSAGGGLGRLCRPCSQRWSLRNVKLRRDCDDYIWRFDLWRGRKARERFRRRAQVGCFL
jgi:hypothetical protein